MKSVEQVLKDIAKGRLVALRKENKDDLGHLFFMAAEFINTDLLSGIASETRGNYSVVMDQGQMMRLGLKPSSSLPDRKPVVISLDHESTVTGESLTEQTFTINKLLDPKSFRHDFRQPGHVVIQGAVTGGLFSRCHAVEAVVDLMKMTDNEPVAVLWQSSLPEETYQQFLERHNISITSFNHIIQYRKNKEDY